MEWEGRLPGTYYNDNNRRQNTTKGNCAIGLQKEWRSASVGQCVGNAWAMRGQCVGKTLNLAKFN